MDPQEYAKKGVDKVYPEYNWMPSTGVQRGSIKSTPIQGDPQTPGFPSVGTTILILALSKRFYVLKRKGQLNIVFEEKGQPLDRMIFGINRVTFQQNAYLFLE